MQYLNGLIYGSGFTTGAFIVIVLVKAIFNTGLC